MKRTTFFILTAGLLLGCEHAGVFNTTDLPVPYEMKLSKVAQGSQFSVYRYDDNQSIIKHEFAHGLPGSQVVTIYADYSYQNNRLQRVEQFVLLSGQFQKVSIEEYDYDSASRLIAIRYQWKSEATNNWLESVQEFHYDNQNRVIKTIHLGNTPLVLQTEGVQERSEERYFYDENGNVSKIENYVEGVEYEGPLTFTYTYDTRKNPFYRHDIRQGVLRFFSPNNLVGWESHSPETGDVVARSSLEYQYNMDDYPTTSVETVRSPLTDPQPGTEIMTTTYEYLE